MTSWKLLVAALALVVLVDVRPAAAASATSSPTVLELADAGAANAGAKDGGIAPMPDAAVQGAACLGAAAAAMGVAYAIGPSELLMLVTGAMHVASKSSVLFIPMFTILGGGSCAMAAAATPAVSWAIEQSGNIGTQVASWFGGGNDAAAGDKKGAGVRALTEAETQGAGCVVGALSGFAASMASGPMEVAMLSSGATTIVSSTPLLAMGLIGTIVASSCGIGALAVLPVVAFASNFKAIGDSILSSSGQVGHMVAQAAHGVVGLAAGAGGKPAFDVAESQAAVR